MSESAKTKIERIKSLLGLRPHPEGGFYAETYRSKENIEAAALPARYQGCRSVGTAIYYLLTAGTFSAMHRLRSDEIFHFKERSRDLNLAASGDSTKKRSKSG
ncbi:MAG: cupin domain-containing protein [Elusimicrobiota bacterium]